MTDRVFPQWLMIGVRITNDCVRIIASQELSQAELRTEYEYADFYRFASLDKCFGRRSLLTADLRSFIIITADTYEHAFQHLFEQWSPEPKRRAISYGTTR